MESLWGEEFSLPDEKIAAKKILKKVKEPKKAVAGDNVERLLKSKKTTIQDKIEIIKAKVFNILGKQADNVLTVYDPAVLEDYIDKAIIAGALTVDTETNNTTNSTNCDLMGLCLYVDGQKQVYVPVNHVDPETGIKLPTQMTEAQIKGILQRAVDAKIDFIYHNAPFDYQVILHTCDIALPITWDTMIAARVLDENERAGLKEQYVEKIDPQQEKYSINALFEGLEYKYLPPELFALYAATDSLMTYKLKKWQEEQFKKPGNEKLLQLFLEIEMPVNPVVAKMEYRGVAVDLALNKRLHDKYQKQLEDIDQQIATELETLRDVITKWKNNPKNSLPSRSYVSTNTKMSPEKIKEMYPNVDEKGMRYKEGKAKASQLEDPINMGSPSQLAILFYDILGCKAVSKNSPRGTGEDELIALDKQYDLNICKLLLKRRTVVKLLSTYIDNIPNLLAFWPDGKIRTHYKQYGADTGRFASGGKIKFFADGVSQQVNGINMQNIPAHEKSLRMQFCADALEAPREACDTNTYKVSGFEEVRTTTGWKPVDKLVVGDLLCFDDGDVVPLQNISVQGTTYTLLVGVLNK